MSKPVNAVPCQTSMHPKRVTHTKHGDTSISNTDDCAGTNPEMSTQCYLQTAHSSNSTPEPLPTKALAAAVSSQVTVTNALSAQWPHSLLRQDPGRNCKQLHSAGQKASQGVITYIQTCPEASINKTQPCSCRQLHGHQRWENQGVAADPATIMPASKHRCSAVPHCRLTQPNRPDVAN